MGDARQDIVEIFSAFGALVDPDVLDHLSQDAQGPGLAQTILSSLDEVPFHVDLRLWKTYEERAREQATPGAMPRQDEAARARKAALKAAAAAIYDGGSKVVSDDIDDVSEDGESVDLEGLEAGHTQGDALQNAKEFRVEPRSDFQAVAKDYASALEVVEDITGHSTCEGSTQDFVSYFRDRYDRIAKMLRQRRELRNAVSIDRIRGGMQEVGLIGMVIETAITKNGHRRIEIEDQTGSITCLARADETQLCAMADSLVPDEVIGVVGTASSRGDLMFLDSLLRPDVPRPDGPPKGADEPVAAAFLSDIHVGSNTFLEENWKRMLRWFNGYGNTRRERELAGRTKYLVIPGDLVDGVGIYPGQQEELTISDVYDQYAAFGDWMTSIPDHVELIIQPGNHDAARPAEPQPAFTQEVQDSFSHHGMTFVANPATFKMHGVTTLGYHGSSLIDFATSVTHLEYEKPLDSMEQMLQTRHLAPLYGERTPVAPEHHDYLVIDEVPDLFVTGHVHVPGVRNYRGVQMINCGTWQSQTLYQKMLNFTPDPARMPITDLQSLRTSLVDFQTPA